MLFLSALPAHALQDGAWDSSAWAPAVWASGVWQESVTLTTVPNVIGEASASAAATVLQGEGLDAGGVTARCSAETEDEVVGQSPGPGAMVPEGSLVDLLVSNGEPCKSGGNNGLRPRARLGL